jgi:hypothetical protein
MAIVSEKMLQRRNLSALRLRSSNRWNAIMFDSNFRT